MSFIIWTLLWWIICSLCFLKQPDLFNAFIAASPNLNIISKIEEKIETRLTDSHHLFKSIYVGVGEYEKDFINKLSKVDRVFKMNCPPSMRWKFDILKGEGHSSSPHQSIYNACIYLYYSYSNFDGAVSRERLIKQFDDLSNFFGYKMNIPLMTLVSLGNQAISNEHLEKALAFFKLIEEMYPDSYWGYIGQGSVYYDLKQHKNAEKCFLKVLELDTNNSYAKDMLNALKKILKK